MENEEKKVKTTAAKKKTTAKKTDTKKKVTKTETKKEPSKKTVKDETKPKTAKKNTTVKKIEKIVEPTVVKEEAFEKDSNILVEEVKTAKISKELKEIRKKRYIIEAVIVGILVIVALVLLLNRTFLRNSYKTEDIKVSIPRFSYFVSDKDNTVKFVTLRKSANLKEYYSEYLESFTFYSCAGGDVTFYYNEETKTLIKEIEIEKDFAIKTIEIEYDSRSPEEVCGLK